MLTPRAEAPPAGDVQHDASVLHHATTLVGESVPLVTGEGRFPGGNWGRLPDAARAARASGRIVLKMPLALASVTGAIEEA